ncbi:MAG: sulfotransferase [Gemmatimonadota bacterium]
MSQPPIDMPPRPEGPGFRHPLMGADLMTLWRARRRYGPVASGRRGLATLMWASAVGRWPFRMLERLRMAWLSRRSRGGSAERGSGPPGGGPSARTGRRSAPPDPLFIVGHWRSGTTHLHNLMARSPEFGIISPLASGLPWEILTLGTWLQPLLARALPEDRHVDRVAVTLDSPQEDEIPVANMQPLSVFHALYFPARFRRNFERGVFFEGVSEREIARWKARVRYFHAKISLQQSGRRLLVKNPVYTARIARLLEIWPDAGFIHIYRNPHVVYASTVHYFREILPGLALQSFDHLQLEDFVLKEFPRLMDRLYEESAGLTENRFAEVRFEDLENDALAVLERLYGRLELSGWPRARPRVEAYLDSISDYRKNAFTYPPRTVARVGRAWARYLDRWGYEAPRAPPASGGAAPDAREALAPGSPGDPRARPAEGPRRV